MALQLTRSDRVGLIHPAVDVHTLGVSSLAGLLEDCGIYCSLAGPEECRAALNPQQAGNTSILRDWITANRISILGFSYRLDPHDAVEYLGRFLSFIQTARLASAQTGPIRTILFAGLSEACRRVREFFPEVAACFQGDEGPGGTLAILGVPVGAMPALLASGVAYDEARLQFGRELVRRGDYHDIRPIDRTGYPDFGTARDTVIARLSHGVGNGLPPLMRAHVGPYLPDRAEAIRTFLEWTRSLAREGLLDILSIGTSQLSQSDFGGDWTEKPNGGGVPIWSREEFREAWQAARPMLVRSYAGTRDVVGLARMFEETIHIAWHALSLWWFCQIDGRGPNSVRDNLREHSATLSYIASTGKPFEANVPHHFAFRGADDVTYVVSAYVAARLAKRQGIERFILQIMLNTPKYTWGIQDLAKARATLQLVRRLEDRRFRVILQPRGGLDYFSAEADEAKAQLAAVTALMDDIEPKNAASPPIIHVVSYSEGAHLADPAVVNESIRITRQALQDYRSLRSKGEVGDMTANREVDARCHELAADARAVIAAIEAALPNPYSAEGLYAMFAAGFFPVPYLWQCREEFAHATSWKTKLAHGSVRVVDRDGRPIPVAQRMEMARANLKGVTCD